MSRKQKIYIHYITCLLVWLSTWSPSFAQSLILKKAEHVAIEQSTEIQSFRAKNESLYQAATASCDTQIHTYLGERLMFLSIPLILAKLP